MPTDFDGFSWQSEVPLQKWAVKIDTSEPQQMEDLNQNPMIDL